MNTQGRVKSMAVSEFDVYVFLSLISGTISTLKLLVMQHVYSLNFIYYMIFIQPTNKRRSVDNISISTTIVSRDLSLLIF